MDTGFTEGLSSGSFGLAFAGGYPDPYNVYIEQLHGQVFKYNHRRGVQWRRGNACASQFGNPGSIPDPVCFSVVKVFTVSLLHAELVKPTSSGQDKLTL